MTTCFLAPDPCQSTFFIPGGAVPGNGVQVFFYVTNTSTKQTVYKDNAAATPWTNPIVLDSGGNLPSGAEVWFPQGQVFTVKWAPSNDTDPPNSPYRTMDNLSGINDVAQSGLEWIAGTTPTFISSTSFSITTDQTATYTVGRRIKTVNTGGTVYSRIIQSTFGAGITTIVVVNDSGNLDSGISAVSYALLASVNQSIPAVRTNTFRVADSTDPTKTGSFSVSSVATSTNVQLSFPTISGIIRTASTTVQDLTGANSSGTYLTPSGVTLIMGYMCAAGGGGAGGNTTGSVGNNGSSTVFGPYTCGGGQGGTNPTGGNGGFASTGTINFPGAAGSCGGWSNQSTVAVAGGDGGTTIFGGRGTGGAGDNVAGNALAASLNVGCGGGGGGSITSAAARYSGGGGGAGGASIFMINGPATSYAYTIGAGGTGAGAGAAKVGADGSAGRITIYEYR